MKKHFWSQQHTGDAYSIDLIDWRRLAVCSRNVAILKTNSQVGKTYEACIESTIRRPKSISIKRVAKTIMLHRCDVENCKDTSATTVEKGEI